MSRQGVTKTKGPCVATRFPQAKSFLVTTECFSVATELAMVEKLYVAIEYFMSQQSVAKWRGFVLRQGILCCNIVGQARKIFYRDMIFLCHDRVG